MVKISKGNSKMGNVLSVNLPPIKTCRADAPCKKDCYAMKAYRMYPNVRNAYDYNLDIYLSNKDTFKMDILKQLPLYGVFRWHVSGDIVDADYFQMMVDIAKVAPNIKFLAFTKKYDIVNNYIASGGKVPKNLNIVYSAWTNFEMPNPYNMPVAWFNDCKNPDVRIPKSAKPCNGDCAQCMKCWNLHKRQSVVFNKH